MIAIFSRGDIGGDAGGGAADGPRAGGADADWPPPLALLTAVWQGEDNCPRWLCRHCNDAMPPVGTLEQ